MSKYLPLLLLSTAAGASAETIPPGRWDVTSTVVELSLPGVPGFIQRMIKGKSKAERKLVSSGQGIDALIAPDPKARCTVETQQTSAGRYAQALSCPQKGGTPIRVLRSGTYDAAGFRGEATVSGSTPKGPMRMVLRQQAARIGD
ncbi:DUF3617 domain-containing protein [Sphingomonas sp. Tas61C01]|uniref:DUF3617 domain-containing protein n=1 Tax=Sphingomonas sp. Tas61C01 TaxID=3458297 RepID=UPI00403EEE55